MYKVDQANKSLHRLKEVTFSEVGFKERHDIQEWIDHNPEILGEDLFIITKEYILPSKSRLDLLALDKQANLVVIELKRDNSGSVVDWQAIRYASYCSAFGVDEISEMYLKYKSEFKNKNVTKEEAKKEILEFLSDEELLDNINDSQRIILVSREFHSDVISSALWLRDASIDIQCIKLEPYQDESKEVYLYPNIIIPLPEAKDYIIRKEKKAKEKSLIRSSLYSDEKSNYDDEKLREELIQSLSEDAVIVPKFVKFVEILLQHTEKLGREVIKKELHRNNIGENEGQAGRYLSNISQFITKPRNPHLRQIINYESEGGSGKQKDNYIIFPQYRELVKDIIEALNKR